MTTEHAELPREGIHFRGEILPISLEVRARHRSLFVLHAEDSISLYIEEQRQPIYIEMVGLLEDEKLRHISGIQLVDMVFQRFIDAGNFSSVMNPDYTAVLMQCALEKAAGADWRDKTYRFVHAMPNEIVRMRGDSKLAALLTKDRRDIIEFEESESRSATAELIADAEHQIALAGGVINKEGPITEDEERFLERLQVTDFLHYFKGGQSKPPLTIFDTNPFV